jgi:hypothetical protein
MSEESKFIVKWDCTAQTYFILMRETGQLVRKEAS